MLENMPFFSVVMTFYSSQKYIRQAINSIINQDFSDYEIILVNNGSTDESREIVQNIINETHNKEFSLIDLEQNRGIAGGRNFGIDVAKGKYICFIDSDDVWYTNKLKNAYYVLKDSDYGLVYHWMDVGSEEKHSLSKRRAINNDNSFFDLVFNGDPIPMSSVIVKSEEIRSIGGFNENCNYAEDFDCWIRLANNKIQFKLIKSSLGLYRIHSESVSQQKQKDYIENTALMLHGHVRKLEKYLSEKKIHKYHEMVDCHKYYLLFNAESDFLISRDYFKRIIKIRPLWIKAYFRFLQKALKR